MSFRFRFETVLNVKSHREEEKRHQLAAKERRLAQKAQQLKGIEDANEEGFTSFLQQCTGTLDLEYLTYSQFYLDYLRQREKECKVEMESARQEVNRARSELVEAQKERKVMEQLKEKEHERYKVETLAKEQKFLDEIGISAHRRKPR